MPFHPLHPAGTMEEAIDDEEEDDFDKLGNQQSRQIYLRPLVDITNAWSTGERREIAVLEMDRRGERSEDAISASLGRSPVDQALVMSTKGRR